MKKPSYDILIKFLDGEASEAEYSEVTRWADSSSENYKELELLKKIYNATDISQSDPDVESAYNKVLDRIRSLPEKGSAEIYQLEPESPGWNIRNILVNPVLLRAAMVIIGSMIALYFIFNPEPRENYIVLNVPNGEQRELTLPDGSMVTLDAGSTIMYPEKFGSESRELQIEGEGFFSVTPDPNSPFIVNANNSRVTVLGTKFNLRAWKNSEKIILAVEEGRVSFLNNAEAGQNEVIVSKGQMSAIERGAPPSVPEDIDSQDYSSWRNREMYFQDVELSEVLNQLQRWYDVRIILPDTSYYSSRVTLSIRNTPLEDNLEVISLVMNFRYEIDGDIITYTLHSE